MTKQRFLAGLAALTAVLTVSGCDSDADSIGSFASRPWRDAPPAQTAPQVTSISEDEGHSD